MCAVAVHRQAPHLEEPGAVARERGGVSRTSRRWPIRHGKRFVLFWFPCKEPFDGYTALVNEPEPIMKFLAPCLGRTWEALG